MASTATVSLPFTGYAKTPSPPFPRASSSIRCLVKNRVGFGAQSSGLFCSERSDLSSAYHENATQSIRSRLRLKGVCRASMIMMPIGLPWVRYPLPDGGYQWLDLNNALYRERVVCLSQFIDEYFSNTILGTLLYLDSVSSTEVLNILILGRGGNVIPSLQIYDTMESLSCPLATFAMGFLCNLSGYMLAAGDKGKRYAMPRSVITFEPISGVARGQADNVINEANELVRNRDYLFQQLSSKTGQPFEKIKKDLSNTRMFTSEEALEYGIIDRIARPRRLTVNS
ncbi:hypothetical protein KI387_032399, partial [Taxus chinensis]